MYTRDLFEAFFFLRGRDARESSAYAGEQWSIKITGLQLVTTGFHTTLYNVE